MKFEEFYYKQIDENAAQRSYSCLMLDCSELKGELKRIQKEIEEEDIYDEEEGHGLETEPHITVLYGIHEQEPKIVKDTINLTKVIYSLTELSLFENEKYDVLKFSVKSKELKALNKQCRAKLEYTSNFPDYIPHMTVAYLNPGTGKKYLKIESELYGEENSSEKFIFSTKDSKKTKWTV